MFYFIALQSSAISTWPLAYALFLSFGLVMILVFNSYLTSDTSLIYPESAAI